MQRKITQKSINSSYVHLFVSLNFKFVYSILTRTHLKQLVTNVSCMHVAVCYSETHMGGETVHVELHYKPGAVNGDLTTPENTYVQRHSADWEADEKLRHVHLQLLFIRQKA